jgi:hypothetical protein
LDAVCDVVAAADGGLKCEELVMILWGLAAMCPYGYHPGAPFVADAERWLLKLVEQDAPDARTITKLFQALDALRHTPSAELLDKCDVAMVAALQRNPDSDCGALMLRWARCGYRPSEALMARLLARMTRPDVDLRSIATLVWYVTESAIEMCPIMQVVDYFASRPDKRLSAWRGLVVWPSGRAQSYNTFPVRCKPTSGSC